MRKSSKISIDARKNFSLLCRKNMTKLCVIWRRKRQKWLRSRALIKNT